MKVKKILSTALAFTMIFTMLVSSAFAENYGSAIDQIMSTFTLQNISASSAPQQQVNGSYRMVELLEVMAKEEDYSSSKISSIMSSFTLQNISASSAPQ